jgi:hypothetical protein
MTRTNDSGSVLETKTGWSVVVVYEDAATRECAVTFCDQLVSRYWAKCEFDVSWWSFALLEESTTAKEAAEKAARAELIIVSARPGGDFPSPLKAWIESWLGERGDREGTLAGLVEGTGSPNVEEGQKHRCLRSAAHRGAMDYVTQLPQDIARSMPDSLDSYTERADQVTSLLDDILCQQTSPSSISP